jgi:ACS family sodium-dependent inorganic phosphate cotransporter-like MFS transporter 5
MAQKFGWPFVYCFFGGISVAWFLPWMFLVYDTPELHPRISDKEKNNILSSLGQHKNEKVGK